MSPNIPPVFEALPAEVLGNILRQASSPEDLYSTIRASPNAFGSFRCFREAIIIEVLQAHLPPEIFAEYLGLLHVPKYEDFDHVPERREFEFWLAYHGNPEKKPRAWESCKYNAWPFVFEAFFETHFANVRAAEFSGIQQYSAPQPADKNQINYLISMYGTLKRFIQDYQSFVRSILPGSPPPLSDLDPSFRRLELHLPQNWPRLNKNETVRLQRGFLRYELCSRLNVIPAWITNIMDWDDGVIQGYDESISKYLQCWEEEEIRCVWTYVHRQYQVFFREVSAEYRCDVNRLSRKARHAPDNEVTLAPNINPEKYGCSLFERWPYNMSCLGLPMLQQFLRSDYNDQRLFLKNTSFDRLPRLEETLFLFDENRPEDEKCRPNQFRNIPTTNGANPIYTPIIKALARWSSTGAHSGNSLRSARNGLREIGWVFWEDPGRLMYLGWPQGASNIRAIITFLDHLGWDHPPNRYEAQDEYPEQRRYVTKDDFQGELSAKYAVTPAALGGRHFFLNRLRQISDWSSKEISPSFREICSGSTTKG